MDETLHNDEKLVRYLDGEMNETDRAEFEAELNQDIQLRERLDSMRTAVTAIRVHGTNEQVRFIHKSMMEELFPKKQHAKVVQMNKWIRYAAAVAAVVSIIVFATVFFTVSSDKVYDDTFVEYTVSNTRSETGQSSNIENLYRDKKYADVVAQGNGQQLSARDSLLTGIAFLKLDSADKAVQWLQPLSVSGSDVQPDAEFYLALAHLKQKKYDSSIVLMEKIRNDADHLYRSNVTDELIEKVRKLK